MRHSMLFLLLCLSPGPLIQDDGSFEIDDVSWIAGTWRGDNGATVIEEIWTPPEGTNMSGMFRMIKNGSPVFLEFQTMEGTAKGVRLSIKHFDEDLTGWEEKDESEVFYLAESSPLNAVFRHESEDKVLTYYGPSSDSLTVTLEEERKGKPTTSRFWYARVRNR